MGDCYATSLNIKFRKNGKNDALRALQNYIKEKDGNGVNFSLDDFKAKRNITPDTFDGIVRIFFADWKGNNFTNGEYRKGTDGKTRLYKYDNEGYRVYSSGFDCSYGWGSQLYKFAEIIAPFLADGSQMFVNADETKFSMEIINGEAVFAE